MREADCYPRCVRNAMKEKGENLIFSYPRSGISWLFLRLNRFLLHRFGIPDVSPAGGFISHSHLGYLPHQEVSVIHHSQRHRLRYAPGTTITVLIRDAKAVLSSVYHYRKRVIDGYTDSAESFLRSNVGVSCLCSFLNDISLIVKRERKSGFDLRFVYYEDMLDARFVDRLPSLLGMGCRLTDNERAAILEDSDFIVHPSEMKDRFVDADSERQVSKHKETIGDSGSAFVDGFMLKYCKLKQYSDRYC